MYNLLLRTFVETVGPNARFNPLFFGLVYQFHTALKFVVMEFINVGLRFQYRFKINFLAQEALVSHNTDASQQETV